MTYLCRCIECQCAAHGTGHERGYARGTGAGHRPDSLQRSPQKRGKHRNLQTCNQAPAVAEPPLGAHLVTPRRGYTHHGIYAGGGVVLHYAGLSRSIRSGPVEEVALEKFGNGWAIHIECRREQALEESEILVRARSRLGENRYRLLTNNCEHFSEWARFGVSRSRQVDRWLRRPTALAQGLASLVRRRPWSTRVYAAPAGLAA
jgi:hypothetical protein